MTGPVRSGARVDVALPTPGLRRLLGGGAAARDVAFERRSA
jgi:hypothetical protein